MEEAGSVKLCHTARTSRNNAYMHKLTLFHFTVQPSVFRGTEAGGVPTLSIVVAGETTRAHCYICMYST